MENKYLLMSGPIFAIGIMLGVAVGSRYGDSRTGILYGMLAASILLNILAFIVIMSKKKSK